MNNLLINRLSLTYKDGFRAIKDLTLEVGNGMFGLLGPNGAGKSSLMKVIAGLQKPTSGNILFNGREVTRDPDPVRKHLGFLPQDFGVYPKVSAYDLMDHIAVLKGIGRHRKTQILNLLEKVNLGEFKNREVHTFSGGMKQRFGVAQALLGDPKMIIVDEPTAGLDPEERNRFNSLLSDISREVIVILSTHLVEDVRNLCSEMAIMSRGQILRKGKPGALIKELENRIWTKAIAREQLDDYLSGYRVISQQLLERELYITVFSEERPEGFSTVDPLLEHVYFHTLNQNSSL